LKAVIASSSAAAEAAEALGAATGKMMVAIIDRENEIKKKMSLLPSWALIRLTFLRLTLFRLTLFRLAMIRRLKRTGLI
jgi:hypothetical protein